jgi:purine nucleosidase
MKRIVIDCDPGIDDAQAIMMAHMHPNIKIEAITSVAGNVGVEKTTKNVLKILDVLGADAIPVFSGAASPLAEPSEDASYFHGEDGLGGAILPDSNRLVEPVSAAFGLISLGKKYPGELELIALGPLTNLALALKLFPKLPDLYQRLVIMGGAYLAQGNSPNLAAEFNIYADPEAAAVVFESWPELTMVTWETTIAHGIPGDLMDAMASKDNPRSKLLKDWNDFSKKFDRHFGKESVSFTADPLAMAVLIEPGIVKGSIQKYVWVERFGKMSRGMTVVDWWGKYIQSPNANIITEVDLPAFIELFRLAFD